MTLNAVIGWGRLGGVQPPVCRPDGVAEEHLDDYVDLEASQPMLRRVNDQAFQNYLMAVLFALAAFVVQSILSRHPTLHARDATLLCSSNPIPKPQSLESSPLWS